MKKTSIVLVLVVILILFQSGKSFADTRVVVSVSIGTGVVVGAVGLFIHLGYSSRVDLLEDDSNISLVLFPDVKPTPSNDYEQVALPEDRGEKSVRAYFLGIRW